MQQEDTKPLCDALQRRRNSYREAVDRLRDLAPDGSVDEAFELATTLREAIELVGCLQRLTKDRSMSELHDAFGAPGDFGYETPIGAALAKLYLGGAS